MQISSADKNRYFYEYAFWDYINAYNQSQIKDERIDRVIRVSEARSMRKRLGDSLKAKGKTMSNAGGLFINSLDDIMRDAKGVTLYSDGYISNKTQLNNFINMVGLKKGSDNVYDENSYLPISPYDPRFSWRRALVENGSRLCSVKSTEVEDVNDLTKDFRKCRSISFYSQPYQTTKNDVTYYTANESGVNVIDTDDMSGVTRLAKYMTREEYADASVWLEREIDSLSESKDLSHDEIRNIILQKSKQAQKSAAILKGLSDMGRPYEISRDEYPGQLKATVNNTKLNVRITEKVGTEDYLGSVYDDGARYLFSTTKKDGNSFVMHNPTPQDSLNLVRFALGEPVKRLDSNKLVGEYEQLERGVGRGKREYNSAYRTSTGFTATYGDIQVKDAEEATQEEAYRNKVRIIASTTNRMGETTFMPDEESAKDYLNLAIENAKNNYTEQLNVDKLIETINKGEDFQLSGNPDIAVIQQGYIDVLTGRNDSLLIPKYQSLEDEEKEADDVNSNLALEESMDALKYYDVVENSKEDIVRMHARDSLDTTFGSLELNSDNKRFDPVNVAKFYESGYGLYRNNRDVFRAMQVLDINPDELLGNDFYNKTVKDRMIKFDEENSKKMKDIDDPFVQDMYKTVKQSLITKGLRFNEDDVLLDDNGVVKYKAYLRSTEQVKDKDGKEREPRELTGFIGQIFTPDEDGVVTTRYAGSDNYAFVPSYSAHIKFQNFGENKSMEERTLLTGYREKMKESIRYSLNQDILNLKTGHTEIGSTTSLNNTYKTFDSERYDVNFRENYLEQGMPEDVLKAIIKTQAQRVRYSNDIRDNSSMTADFRAHQYNYDYANDNYGDPYILTGCRNISVLTKQSDGYFDPIATTSTTKNQGAVRYLVEGTEINEDKTIKPGAKDARCAIMSHEISKYSQFDPFDRQCMMISNLLQANSVSEPVKSMDVTLGGLTQDDAIVISKRFAEKYPMRKADGSLRPLMKQDKLSDMHGNKGVISYVMDTDKSWDEIKQNSIANGFEELRLESLKKAYEFCKQNKDVDVFMAPFTQPSRFNAGTAREKLNDSFTTKDSNGFDVIGGGGKAKFIITDKSAESKTHIYDDEAVLKGKGRRMSGQIAWALTSKGASNIMRECFGNNADSLLNAREYFITTGLDITETGDIIKGYKPHKNEERVVFKMPELEYKELKSGTKVDTKKMCDDFCKQLTQRGGIMELPFPLKYPTGEDIALLNKDKTDVIYKQAEWERKGYTRKDGVYVRPTTIKRNEDLLEKTSWGLPVMSSHLRSGQELIDGSVVIHDYTNKYVNVFKESLNYRENEKLLKEATTDEEKAQIQAKMNNAQSRCQEAFNSITEDIKQRKFTGKNNMFKEELMAHKMSKSASAVWSPDPSLKIDEIGVGVDIAKKLGVKAEDVEKGEAYLLVVRDPVLRNSNVRYLKVKIDPSLSGCSINPNMDVPFSGDFDGDVAGVFNLQDEESKKEAKRLFGVQANLLDLGTKTKVFDKEQNKEVEVYPLNMNNGLDIKVAMHYNPELADKWNELTLRANKLHNDIKEGKVVGSVKKEQLGDELIDELSDFYQQCSVESVDKAHINYASVDRHLDSVYNACIKTGAKGSPKKIDSYMQYLGVGGCKCNEDGIDKRNLKEFDQTLATREMNQGVMFATNTKNIGTGFAGAVSQRAIRAVGDKDAEIITELTYPVTQAILQSKHDPVDAERRFSLLMRPVRQLWDGRGVSYNEKTNSWKATADRVSPEEWKKSFKELYKSDVGLGVDINDEYVDKLADIMSENNVMKSVEIDRETGFAEGCSLYRLAYSGDFDTAVSLADESKNLFDGNNSQMFTPFTVLNNKKIVEGEKTEREVSSLTKSDVLVDGKAKKPSYRKPITYDVKDDFVMPEFSNEAEGDMEI